MAKIRLGFDNNINASLQIGDILYFIKDGKNVEIGDVTNIDGNNITANISSTAPRPNEGDYFFFAKDNTINSSGMLGYYANTKLVNTSEEKAELYAINSEINLSSN